MKTVAHKQSYGPFHSLVTVFANNINPPQTVHKHSTVSIREYGEGQMADEAMI